MSRLERERSHLMETIQNDFVGMGAEIDNIDWHAASASATRLAESTARMSEVALELDDVEWIINSFDRITKRLEELESGQT
jgi:hypothetical protein